MSDTPFTIGEPPSDPGPPICFDEALRILGIEDFKERIFNSSSHGELMHLADYAFLARTWNSNLPPFRPLFLHIVKFAEDHWKRPESIFQHIIAAFQQAV